jgi:hypothetical protein
MDTNARNDETQEAQEAQEAQAAAEEAERELEDVTEERMRQAFADDDTPVDETADDEEEGSEEPDEESPEESEDEDDEEEVENDPTEPRLDEDGEDDEEEPDEEAAAETEDEPSDAPTLPDAYRRSLRAYGWTDEAIEQNARTMGSEFLNFAENVHRSRNAQTAEWAAQGRKAREAEQEQEQAPTQQTAQQPGGVPSLQRLDPKQLADEYGDEEFVNKITAPINATIDEINAIVPQLQQLQQDREAARQTELQNVTNLVEGFFRDDEMKAYTDVYGDSFAEATEQQQKARNKVLDTAYDLVYGASLRGVEMPLSEALMSAHDVVTADNKESAARQSIEKQMKKRSKSRSSKPTAAGRATRKPAGKPATEEDLEAATVKRLQKLFG